MKRIIATAIAVAALALAGTVSANTGTLSVTCTGLTFQYQNFPSNTSVHYNVSNGKKVVSGDFTISDAGTVSVAVDLKGAVVADLTWVVDGDHHISASGTLGCGGPGLILTPPPSSGVPIYDYCLNGSNFAELEFGQPLVDPRWFGYTAAVYVEGLGTMCFAPAGYKDRGTKVDPVGQNYGGNEEGAIYEYWVKV